MDVAEGLQRRSFSSPTVNQKSCTTFFHSVTKERRDFTAVHRPGARGRDAAAPRTVLGVKVTLLLADFARVASGKLDVIGGGWSMMNAQGPFGFFVAALFQIPWDQTNQKHQFRLELLDADGQGVPTPDGETIRAEGEFEAGRPAGLRPGTPVDAPLVVPFGPLVLEQGRYEIRLTIDGETKEDWFVAFTVRQAPAPQ
jgi:hypothetical protein